IVVSIADRRWRWQFSQISGRYNVRAGGKLKKETVKSARELAELCLKELGEKNYDVRAVPGDTFPLIDWDLQPINAALDQLCQQVGCHVALTENDRITVMPDGKGRDIPNFPSSSKGIAFDFGIRPGRVGVASAPAEFQLDFELHPVGLDIDNSLKDIWELSYIPVDRITGQKTWHYEPDDCMNIKDKTARSLAQQTVWKWFLILPPGWIARHEKDRYRIEPGAKGLKTLPGTDELIRSHRQFVFLDHQLDTEKAPVIAGKQSTTGKTVPLDKQTPVRRSPAVFGYIYDGMGAGTDNVENTQDEPVFGEELVYPKGFAIDQERGIVIFADPVYRYDLATSHKIPPFIRLRVAAHFQNENRALYRHFKTREIKGAPDSNLTAWQSREDVLPEHILRYAKKLESETNIADVDKRLEHYLEFAAKKYEIKTPGSATFPFLVPYSPDGLIAQVIYQIDGQGFLTTSIHREREQLSNLVTYEERREAVQQLATMERLSRLSEAQSVRKADR
ncbi:MAG: hypothetical protein ACTHK7_17055, partial [Aureliella sp.]